MSLSPKSIDFVKTWNELEKIVKNVVTLCHVPRTIWNKGFSDIYSLCVAHPEPFADRLYHETKRFLNEHVCQLQSKVKVQVESGILQAYYNAWKTYSQGIKYLNDMYLYLNVHHIRKYKISDVDIIYGNYPSTVPDSQQQMEIEEMGLDIWKKNMIMSLKDDLVSLLLENIHADRVGKSLSTSTDVICGVINSFVLVDFRGCIKSPQLYQEIFEKRFFETSGEFYAREAMELLQKSDVTKYMRRVMWRVNQEELRAHKFLYASSVPKVRQCCEEKLIASNVAWLHSEATSMIEEERRSDLALLYQLLRPLSNGLGPLVQELTEHITKQGLQAIAPLQGENIHIEFVETTLDVHAKYSEIIKEDFKSDQLFVGALDSAFSAIVNYRPDPQQPTRVPEYLAKYYDFLLKKSAKVKSYGGEIEEKLGRSIIVFKYVDDKDVFQKFYSRMLAKRLIHQLSQSMDAEEMMIDRLRQACGYEFTSKLHRMFTDMSVSADLNAKFTASLRKGSGESQSGIGFVVYVLQAGAWPLGLPTIPGPFCVPQQLEKSVQAFETFYHAQFSGRKLTWLHHLCHGELKFNYLKKPYLVMVQTYQVALLLLFEDCDKIQCKDAADSLHLTHDQLVKHVTSLLECKILLADTKGQLEEDNTLSLNFDYYNKRTKFRIAGGLQREVPHDIEVTHRSVEEDRKLYVQAAIVRIMKSRRIVKHNQLVQEVLGQSKSKFAPTVSMIKKCIESLIDKQYIERTPNNADEYSYIT